MDMTAGAVVVGVGVVVVVVVGAVADAAEVAVKMGVISVTTLTCPGASEKPVGTVGS